MPETERPSSQWTEVWKFRTPVDPDYGGATSTATLWRDNLGGLVLGMDQADGERVIVLPISADDADDLAAAIHEHRTATSDQQPSRCGVPWDQHPSANGEPYCERSSCPATDHSDQDRRCSTCGWGLHGDICGHCNQPATSDQGAER